MKKLTSRATFFYKRVFPVVWFGFVGVFLLVGLFSSASGKKLDIMFFVLPLGMAVFGYFIMKKMLWDLMDEVYDEGSCLLFRNGDQEVRVNLEDIKNVSYSVSTNPPRVTMSVRHKTAFGDELTFSPPASLVPFKKDEAILRLIDRIDDARRGKR